MVVCNIEAIYATNLCLVNLEKVLNYKLLPITTAVFQGGGNMRNPKVKSILKSELAVETSIPYHQHPHTLVIDVKKYKLLGNQMAETRNCC